MGRFVTREAYIDKSIIKMKILIALFIFTLINAVTAIATGFKYQYLNSIVWLVIQVAISLISILHFKTECKRWEDG